jgi:hypothetical protein
MQFVASPWRSCWRFKQGVGLGYGACEKSSMVDVVITIINNKKGEDMRNNLRILAVVVLSVVCFSQPAIAREFADIYEECGIGAMIAPKNPAVAAVTNVSWDSGTTAISSNVTSPDTCQGEEEKTAAFIHGSYSSLENDLSKGSGKYLDTLAELVGINSEAKGNFIEKIRQNFAKVVAGSDYTNKSPFEKAEVLYDLVYQNS